jgi:hypothetical protein
MTSSLAFATLVIPVGATINNVFLPGSVKAPNGGKFLYIRSATVPFMMQFDGGQLFQAEGGFKFTEEFGVCYFYNFTLNPITVTYYTGAAGVDYIGTNQVKVASTYLLGNLGLKATGNYQPVGLGVPTQLITIGTGAAGMISLAPGSSITVYGVNNGHQRKGIIFSTWNASSNFLVQDLNGGTVMCVSTNNSSIYLETDATLIVECNTNNSNPTSVFSIGEIYYAN